MVRPEHRSTQEADVLIMLPVEQIQPWNKFNFTGIFHIKPTTSQILRAAIFEYTEIYIMQELD